MISKLDCSPDTCLRIWYFQWHSSIVICNVQRVSQELRRSPFGTVTVNDKESSGGFPAVGSS